MKHLFKIAILILGLLLVTYACQKDDISTKDQNVKATISYKKLSLDEIEKLKPVVNNIKRIATKTPIGALARDFSFLSLDSLDTENIIEYTDTTGYSTWTFKMNGLENTINFENLHLLETDDGYIGYILSFEPDDDWYNNQTSITPEGDVVLDFSNFQGDISKYSLEREVIWTTKEEEQASRNAQARAGGFITVCVYTIVAMCDHGESDHPWGTHCTGNKSFDTIENCNTVWSSGGSTSDGDNSGNDNNNGGSSSNNDDCETTGTIIQGSVPLTGIDGGCAPNDVLGIIPDVEADECIVSPAVGNSVISCIVDNTFLEPALYNFLLDPANACTVGEIALFLGENGGCSVENEGFIELAIEALIDEGEVDFDEKLILNTTFKNNDRLKCIFDKLKGGNNSISNYLENFLGENPVARLKFSTDNNFQANNPSSPNVGAKTIEPQNYIIEIIFNTDSNSTGSAKNFPTLVLASDLMHEILHAEMYRKLLSVAQQPEIPWSEEFINGIKDDFPTLSEYYLRWKYGNPSQPAATAQHQLMADYYRDMIVNALKDFDNNAHGVEFYEMLAWSGLTGTVAWNNLSSNEQNNFISQFNTAIQNESYECNN